MEIKNLTKAEQLINEYKRLVQADNILKMCEDVTLRVIIIPLNQDLRTELFTNDTKLMKTLSEYIQQKIKDVRSNLEKI